MLDSDLDQITGDGADGDLFMSDVSSDDGDHGSMFSDNETEVHSLPYSLASTSQVYCREMDKVPSWYHPVYLKYIYVCHDFCPFVLFFS